MRGVYNMKRKNDIYWGLIFVLVGVTMILNLTGVFGTFSIFKLAWSIIFIALILNSLYKLNFLSASLYSAILAHINIDRLGLKGNVFLIYVSSLLIGFGLNSIFKRKRRDNFTKAFININGEEKAFTSFKDLKHEYKNRSTTDDLKGNHVYFENNLGSSVRYVKSDNLKSAYVENNLGTLNVYFTDTIFSPEGCNINVECNVGNINIYLPNNINYYNNISTSLGSVKSAPSFHSDDSYPNVYLEGEVNVGEVKIIFV